MILVLTAHSWKNSRGKIINEKENTEYGEFKEFRWNNVPCPQMGKNLFM